ncbi:hypothetical protein N7539_005998, partial [Penicillium diatomitis]
MKFSILAAISVVEFALAQNLTQLPFCAISCAFRAIASAGCSVTDAKCICTKDSFFTDINSCLTTSCSGDNKQKTIDFARSFCGSAGVSIPTPPRSSAPVAAPTRAASSTTVFSSTAVATTISSATVSVISNGHPNDQYVTNNVRLPITHVLV